MIIFIIRGLGVLLIGGLAYNTINASLNDKGKMEEFNAMYAEAIENGFDVSDSELKEYIKDLKCLVENSKNNDEIKKEIEQFNSEEEFWLYQEKVYKKKLPVQKYVASLEKEYNEGIKQNISEVSTQ